MSLIAKNDCVSVTHLNHSVRHKCYIVEVCSELLKFFYDYCLFDICLIIYSVLTHWWVVYAILLPCLNTACSIKLLSQTQSFYITELYLILTNCWGIRYIITLLINSQFQYIVELNPIIKHCWVIPYLITLLSVSEFQYIAELYSILTQCLGKPNFLTLLC